MARKQGFEMILFPFFLVLPRPLFYAVFLLFPTLKNLVFPGNVLKVYSRTVQFCHGLDELFFGFVEQMRVCFKCLLNGGMSEVS